MSHPVWGEQWSFMPLDQRLVATGRYVSSLDRRRREYKRMGWVYFMYNPALKDRVFKVGQTRRWPWDRALDLTRSTGVYGEFSPVYFVHAGDRTAAEGHAHQLPAQFRVTQGKEFFEAPLSTILTALDDAAVHWPVWIGWRNPKALPQPFMMFRRDCERCGAATLARELLIQVRAKCFGCGAPLDA